MMPLYHQAEHYAIDDVIQDLIKILSVVTKVHDIAILGGEPLLHPELYKLLEWLSKQKSIEQISIISNATVIPNNKNLEAIKNNNVRLRFSDYGQLSVNLDKLVDICEESNIPYFINKEEWVDMGATVKHSYTENELKKMFVNCPFVHDYIILKGRLYRCAHVAHLMDLGIVESAENDYVDFRTERDEGVLKRKLHFYLKEIEKLDSCIFCNGVDLNRKIEPAIQK